MKDSEINRKFVWPLAKSLELGEPKKPLHKPDIMLESLEDLIVKDLAWCPIEGATKRTEPEDKLEDWLDNQMRHLRIVRELFHRAPDVTLRTPEFPKAGSQKRIITTSRSILYLVDKTTDFIGCVSSAFGKVVGRKAEASLDLDISLCLFVSNSVESGGRAYSGDPFTGQVAAYSKIMCYDILNGKTRNFVAYYPHQLFSQFFNREGKKPDNKGVKVIESNVDLIITAKGILLDPKSWSLL